MMTFLIQINYLEDVQDTYLPLEFLNKYKFSTKNLSLILKHANKIF